MNESDQRLLAFAENLPEARTRFGAPISGVEGPTMVTPLTLIPLAAFIFCQAMGQPAKGGQPPVPHREGGQGDPSSRVNIGLVPEAKAAPEGGR